MCVLEVEYVPSLHFAVASAGPSAGFATTCAFPVDEGAFPVAGGVDFSVVGEGGGGGVFLGAATVPAAAAAGVAAANHVFTPPCFEQAPVCVFALV